MTSYNEDLERAAAVLRGVTDHEVEIADKSVYVNFGHREAVVVEPVLDVGRGKMWVAVALAWDRTGGVDAEHELGEVRFEYLPVLVKAFLDIQEENERKLDDGA